MSNRAQTPSAEQMNAAREQVVINTRIVSLKHAMKLAAKDPGPVEASKVVADAKAIEAYIVDNIDAVKPRSGLVVTSQMPPPGAGFVPGK